jgi:hypothetical protein
MICFMLTSTQLTEITDAVQCDLIDEIDEGTVSCLNILEVIAKDLVDTRLREHGCPDHLLPRWRAKIWEYPFWRFRGNGVRPLQSRHHDSASHGGRP